MIIRYKNVIQKVKRADFLVRIIELLRFINLYLTVIGNIMQSNRYGQNEGQTDPNYIKALLLKTNKKLTRLYRFFKN